MRKLRTAFALALALLTALAAGCVHEPENKNKYSEPVDFEGEPHSVSVFFVNAGKADSAVVVIDGHAWLVDAGEEESFVNIYSALEVLGVKMLEGVILSHGHEDHIGGLEPILQKYPVAQVIVPELQLDSSGIDALISENGLDSRTVRAGDVVGVADGVSFEVLAPLALDKGDDNDNSLVVMLRVNGRRFLFTGDMQFNEDGALTASGADIKCDVLKVPNHGNPDATSEDFAKAAAPLIAVISTDTKVDKDSANRVVKGKLRGAEIILTEEHTLGVLVTVSKRGEIAVEYPERPSAQYPGLKITEASKAHQSLVLTNEGAEQADLSGMFVWSSKGCETFVFPEGAALAPGASVTVAAKKSDIASSADFIIGVKKIWADSKTDFAVLCDKYGNELSRLESK